MLNRVAGDAFFSAPFGPPDHVAITMILYEWSVLQLQRIHLHYNKRYC